VQVSGVAFPHALGDQLLQYVGLGRLRQVVIEARFS
jgi:hypothetical protein